MRINTASAEERKALLGYLIGRGCRWHGSADYTLEEIEEIYPWEFYPAVDVSRIEGRGYLSGNRTSNCDTVPASAFEVLNRGWGK